ncbi:MAG: hypothetical protein K0R38_3813 [Polyangiaceae bacterium]|jgi:hypothetical protein|nr:hypothetical protein [Polyangiaceae bacterium]
MYGGGNGGAHQGTESMGAAGAQSGETEASMTGYELSDFPRCGDANLVSLRAACGSTPSEPTFVESGGGSRSSPCTSSS